MTDAQRASLVTIRDEARRQAMEPGVRLATAMLESYEKMLSGPPDPAAQAEYRRRATEAFGQIAEIANKNTQNAVDVLTSAQRQRMRGELRKAGQLDLLTLILRVYGVPLQ